MGAVQSPLSGMTGFARVSGALDGFVWQWEVRSVNGRNLDMRVKLPAELTVLDAAVRNIFSGIFARGNLQISLSLTRTDSAASAQINEALFDKLASFIWAKGGNSDIASLMLVEGVVTSGESTLDAAAEAALHAALTASARELAEGLKSARDTEGAALAPLFEAAISQIQTLTVAAQTAADGQSKDQAARLQAQISALDIGEIGADRMAQEIAMLATKSDVTEELDRLRAHAEQAQSLVAQGSPIGRKLDFLSQEFNREINTLCAKSADITLTRIGIEMKSVVEQFREQAANVE